MVQNDLPDVISVLCADRISWTGIGLVWLQSGSIHLIVAVTFTSSQSSHSMSLQSPVPAHTYYKICYMRISVRWTVKFLTLVQNFRFTTQIIEYNNYVLTNWYSRIRPKILLFNPPTCLLMHQLPLVLTSSKSVYWNISIFQIQRMCYKHVFSHPHLKATL